MIIVREDGDISLHSLVNLDNVHEVSKLSIGPYGGRAYIVSLTTDSKGRPLLVICTTGIPRRYLHAHDLFFASLINPSILFITLEIGTRSINLVRLFNIEMTVVAVQTRNDTVACLCMNMEESTFTFVIITVDGTTNAVLHIPRIPADPEVSWKHM